MIAFKANAVKAASYKLPFEPSIEKNGFEDLDSFWNAADHVDFFLILNVFEIKEIKNGTLRTSSQHISLLMTAFSKSICIIMC